MYSSQHSLQVSSRRPVESIRVAPYLTHMVTHHGQVTLVPPQNAGRIRKPKKKAPEQAERRNQDDEPRFTTAVPPPSSKRVHTAPQPRPTRKLHATTAGSPSGTQDPLLDVLDTPVPDYPPPSFQEAISCAPSPYTLSPAAETVTSVALGSPRPSSPSSPSSPPSSRADHPLNQQQTAPRSPHPPLSPFPTQDSHTSTSDTGSASDDSSGELVVHEPSQQIWEEERSSGLALEERVRREFLRQQASESVVALNALHVQTPPSSPGSRARKCSHCGSLRPPADGRDEGDSDDEHQVDAARQKLRGSPSKSGFRNQRERHDALSAPSSLPNSPTSGSLPNPWASTTTLSNLFHKSSPLTPTLKRKESFGVRRLFTSSKGKERAPSPLSPIDLTRASITGDDLDSSWEVVESSAGESAENASPSSASAPPAKEAASSSLPVPFVNRAFQRYRQPAVSPYTVTLPSTLPFPPPEKAPLGPPPTEYPPVRRQRRPPPPPPPRRTAMSMRSSPSAPPSVVSNHGSGSADVRRGPSPLAQASPAVSSHSGSSRVPLSIAVAAPSSAPTPQSAFDRKINHGSTSAQIVPLGEEPLASLVRPSLLHQTVATTLPLEQRSSTTPSTPTTPTSGRHYPGRPLPCPPQSPSIHTTPVVAELPLPLPAPAQLPIAPRVPGDLTPETTVHEVHATDNGFSDVTDLEVFVSRIDDQARDGRNYEQLLIVSDIIGPAQSQSQSDAPISTANSHPFLGTIEVERRRVTKDGRIKLKLTLLGVVVDKCGICLSQFKEAEVAALGPVCQHSFHERCLRRWLALNRTCPLCRVILTLDNSVSSGR